MKKLRLTTNEWEEMLKDISMKYHECCNRNIMNFEYTKADVAAFIKNNEPNNIKNPIIQITSDAYVKMYELVNQSSVEIQWHGLVIKEDNIYTIYDILVFPQTNSATSTNSNQNEFAEWQTKLIMDMNFPIDKMRMHGHSHVNMNVYSSAIDDGYQSELITKVDENDYYIFLVLNKRMEMYPLLYDFEQQTLFEGKDIEIQILDQSGQDIKKWCSNQIKENCKTATTKHYGYTPPKPKTNFQIEKEQKEFNQRIADIMQKPKSFTVKGGKHGSK